MAAPDGPERRSYFAITRIFARWRGGSDLRGENNGAEAYLCGLLIFALTYAFLFTLLQPNLPEAIGLLLLVWLWWLLMLYLNSILIRLIRYAGLAHRSSNAEVQSNIIIAEVTGFAVVALGAGGIIALLGWFWLGITAINFFAALLLSVLQTAGASRLER